MIVSIRSLAGASALVLALCATSCNSTSRAAMSEEEFMAKWTSYATPGEAHKVLAYKTGTWSVKVKCYMSSDAPAMESKGTSDIKWTLGEHYLEENVNGEFGGMPFQGRGILGYDNMKQKYVGTWIDNMGTGVMYSEGTYDPSTKSFHYSYSSPDFVSGQYVASRSIEKKIDNDHWTVQMWGPGRDSKDYLSMELEYTRIR